MSLTFDIELDTCGLNCPLPILKAKNLSRPCSLGKFLKSCRPTRAHSETLKPLPNKQATICCFKKHRATSFQFGLKDVDQLKG